ncbi:hypothetical protein K438DRAFT_1826365 [Mycena galopus ATCC 62051]|nr:hypothetical protein K438DRAFT_1826365 [Mycena galopus ATCC 62051]
MSETELASYRDPAVKQYKKKKRRRDDDEDERVEGDKIERKKKKKKHDEDTSGDNLLPIIGANSAEDPYIVKEEKKKKKKEKKEKKERAGGKGDIVQEQPDETATEPLEVTEKKKGKRKRDSGDGNSSVERVVEPGGDVSATRERKKKKKHEDLPVSTTEAGDISPTQELTDPSVKKKKKSKEKQSTDPSSAGPVPSSQPPPDSLFPVSNYAVYPPYLPGARPSAPSLFPALPFPDLALGSNEDVLRALQNLDVSKIAGVLKTLTDAADAAGIPSTSTQPPPVASTSTKKHRRTLDLTLPSSSSESQSGHAHLLATKWMGPAKLAELVASEGLVYKKGKFSAIEIQQVNEAIENYRTTRGLSEADVNAIIFPSDEKQKDAAFWSEITSAVAERPIIAVYHYVRRARHPLKQQGKWRADEDVKLIQAVTSLGQQWEKVAQQVGRMATDCRDRYRNHIVDREKKVTGTWSSAEEEELTRIVLQLQKGKSLDVDIFWSKVSQMMGGTRSRQQCRIKWTDSLCGKHKAEGQTLRWSSRDAFILVHKIDSLNVRDDTEIDWKTLPDPQWNLWSAHSLQRRWLTLKKGIKGFEDMTHTEIMDILRAKNAEIPKIVKVVSSKPQVAEGSDDDEPRAGSSTAAGTLAWQRDGNEDDSDSE